MALRNAISLPQATTSTPVEDNASRPNRATRRSMTKYMRSHPRETLEQGKASLRAMKARMMLGRLFKTT